MVGSVVFIILLLTTIVVFSLRIKTIASNIRLGRPFSRSDRKWERIKMMTLVAIGQSKMVTRPVAGMMHIFVYLGFVIINIEVLEIVIDGVSGSHRVFLGFTGPEIYSTFISIFEVLALLVIVACIVFLIRRNVIQLKRFRSREMTTWPKSDANIILITEILLMTAFLTMDGADQALQFLESPGYHYTGIFSVSSSLFPLMSSLPETSLVMIERFTWWFHIVGILAFLNYVPYSKHFHIFLAFPNVYFSNLEPKGKLNSLDRVTKEVKLMLDPTADPYSAPAAGTEEITEKFGAKDVTDLTRKQLLDAYTCTECGRCTSNCPANITGKKLSPRKIMMDTRDRLEEYGKLKNTDKSLLYNYISEEELWACTTCNACTESCPVNIDPLSIILDLRRYLVMEESKIPASLMTMSNNIENNGAPWQFAAADRGNWSHGT